MILKHFLFCCFLLTGMLQHSCTKDNGSSIADPVAGTFKATSTAFIKDGTLPKLYTCDSLGIAPPLSWTNAPAGTTSFAITMHTIPPSPPNHVYMLIYNIPANITALPENSTGLGIWGINTVNGQQKYTPPCSQGPGAKLYTFTVYALSAPPIFSVPASQVNVDLLLSAISGKTLASSIINVTYTR